MDTITCSPERVQTIHLIGQLLRDDNSGTDGYERATGLMRMFQIGPDEINEHAGCEG